MKTKTEQDYIKKEFNNFIAQVYTNTPPPPDMLRHIELAFIAGMLSTFMIRKEMSAATGVGFVDVHCDAIYKQAMDHANALVAKNAAKRN